MTGNVVASCFREDTNARTVFRAWQSHLNVAGDLQGRTYDITLKIYCEVVIMLVQTSNSFQHMLTLFNCIPL